MSKYFQVNVELRDVNEKGKVTKTREQYLVDAETCVEAETKVVKKFTDEGNNLDYIIPSVKETKILEVIK
jgi:hypothetical protein